MNRGPKLQRPSPHVIVAVPTIDARGDAWKQAADAFQRHTCQPVQVIPSYAPGGWAAGLNEVWRHVRIRRPEVFCCGSDDMIPEDDNWLPPLLEALRRGVYPAPTVIDPRWTNYGGHASEVADGTPSTMSTFPTLLGAWCDSVFPLPDDLSYYCMPEDHRILTQRGYRRHDETIIGEPVLVRDPQTRELRWEPLQAVNVLPYDGELITINRKGESFEFTPDHRWLVRNSNQRDHHFRRGRDLTTNLSIEVWGDYQETQSCLSPRYAAMLGWVVGDGTYYTKGKYNRMCVYQMPTEKLDEIEQLLQMKRHKAMPNGVHTVSVQADDRRELEKVYSGKHDLPRVVCNLSRESAEAMLDALIKAEGHRTAYGGTCISQDHKAVAVREAIQILTLLTGHTAGLGQNGLSIFIRTAKALSLQGKALGRKHHKGYVWCPTTPTGTWIVEHEGAIIPTGNCDNLIAIKLAKAGIDCVATPSSRIRHLWLAEGRGFGHGDETKAMAVHSRVFSRELEALGVDRDELTVGLGGPLPDPFPSGR